MLCCEGLGYSVRHGVIFVLVEWAVNRYMVMLGTGQGTGLRSVGVSLGVLLQVRDGQNGDSRIPLYGGTGVADWRGQSSTSIRW